MSDSPVLVETLRNGLFRGADSSITIDRCDLVEAVESYGSPLYVYSSQKIRDNYKKLNSTLDGFASVYYSVKANPNVSIVNCLVNLGCGAEIASRREFDIAIEAGCKTDKIVFAGPAKSEQDIKHVMSLGIGELHVESIEEINRANQIAQQLDIQQPVSIRINPSAALKVGAMRMGGVPSPFGIDEEQIPGVLNHLRRMPGLSLHGVHVYSGTQILDASSLLLQWNYAIEISSKIARENEIALKSIDLGGGLGIPYYAGQNSLSLDVLTEGVEKLKFKVEQDEWLESVSIIVEPGRYLVGDAGIYLCRVNNVKKSRDQRFVVTDGGLHHNLAATGNLGQIVKRDYPIFVLNKTSRDISSAKVVGPLCTPLDCIGAQTELPEVEVGDVVCVMQSGAYGLTASPNRFLGHDTPVELLLQDGNMIDINSEYRHY